MIDAEVKIFNRVHASVAPLCTSKGFVSTVITKAPTSFPAASLIEISNRTVQSRQSSSLTENYVEVIYQLDVYATTKRKCKEVAAAADYAMIGMNFIRISGQFINNLDNTKVFRYVSRYEAVIDREGNIYRRS